jgi:hypothetical protein
MLMLGKLLKKTLIELFRPRFMVIFVKQKPVK